MSFCTHTSHIFLNSVLRKQKNMLKKKKEPKTPVTTWSVFLNFLQQLSLAEKSYIEIGFLQNKHKSFLRKRCKYDRIYNTSSNRQLRYLDILNHIETIIQRNSLGFIDISMTAVRAVFSLECEILEQLFKALTELQRLQFLPSLALIHGAHTRLNAWESKMQNRERLKGAVLSKFSLYFHGTLAQQTTPNDMRQLCSKLQHDYYQKMVTFQRKYDAACVILLSDNQVSCDTTDYDSFPIIVSYPPRSPPQLDMILKMISETANDLLNMDKVIYKFSSQEQCTYILTTVEPNIYLVIFV
ncbi:hypothetical protein NQ318_014513 [Aromia moschata]|uniref:Uncharacterized protein n=1 Tax=Aromia moschata TaxID=1265417 RepID=A0AAV8YND5_9CUCU|nr:hypothetical protein NQ318_014513 [Aromia moschata]